MDGYVTDGLLRKIHNARIFGAVWANMRGLLGLMGTMLNVPVNVEHTGTHL